MPNEEILSKLRAIMDEPTPLLRLAASKRNTVFEPPEGGGPLITPSPPQFQPEPQVVGRDAGLALRKLMGIAPGLQGMVNKVEFGPTSDVRDRIDRSNDLVKKQLDGKIFDPQEGLKGTNVMGLTNLQTGNVSLNPTLRKPQFDDDEWNLMGVLGHEATHAAGHGDEEKPEEVRKLINLLTNSGYFNKVK